MVVLFTVFQQFLVQKPLIYQIQQRSISKTDGNHWDVLNRGQDTLEIYVMTKGPWRADQQGDRYHSEAELK